MDSRPPRIHRLLRWFAALSSLMACAICIGLALWDYSAVPHPILLLCAMSLLVIFLLLVTAISLFLAYITQRSPTEFAWPPLNRLTRWLTEYLLGSGTIGYYDRVLANEVLRSQSQIDALQNQINPHFLYNTLESIRGKAILHDEDEIASMIETLALLFRYNINRGRKSASITDELENVKNYVAIQNYRFRNKFSLEIQMGELKDTLKIYQIPPLTLQPIVENAIHYGLEQKAEPGTISIGCILTQSTLVLEVRDDGIGMPYETVHQIQANLRNTTGVPLSDPGSRARSSGIALRNVHRRIQLLFGEEYGLEIMSAQNVGTQVNIVLPAPKGTEKQP